MQSSASSFNFHYPLISLRSSSSHLYLPITSILPTIFPLVMCWREQFLVRYDQIQPASTYYMAVQTYNSFQTNLLSEIKEQKHKQTIPCFKKETASAH